MAESKTPKEKYLYVLGTEHGEKFFNGGRALSSVLNRNVTLRKKFNDKFGDRYRSVRDYYVPRKGLVVIQDVSTFVPELVAAAVEVVEADEERAYAAKCRRSHHRFAVVGRKTTGVAQRAPGHDLGANCHGTHTLRPFIQFKRQDVHNSLAGAPSPHPLAKESLRQDIALGGGRAAKTSPIWKTPADPNWNTVRLRHKTGEVTACSLPETQAAQIDRPHQV